MFEIGVDFHRRHDRPQVGGHRLVERQQREAAAVDFDVEVIERLVADHHAIDQLVIPIDEPLDGEAHVLFGEPAHFEQPGLQPLEFFLKVPDDAFDGFGHGFRQASRPALHLRMRTLRCYPNLPVT